VTALIPGAGATLLGWMTSAWRRDEPWSWVAWAVVCGLGLLGCLAHVGGSAWSWGDGVTLGVGALTLVLLLHPDSRARLDRLGARRADTVGRRRAP
jgi:hypothetical protein